MISTFQNIADLKTAVNASQGVIINEVIPVCFSFSNTAEFAGIIDTGSLFFGEVLMCIEFVTTTNDINIYFLDNLPNLSFIFKGGNFNTKNETIQIKNILAATFIDDVVVDTNVRCYAFGYKLIY